jgi:hypothetical protein
MRPQAASKCVRKRQANVCGRGKKELLEQATLEYISFDALNLYSVIPVLKKSWTNIAQQPYNTRKTAKKMTAVRDIQEMDNPERLRYFRVIDQLRGFGINEDLPLPQVSFRLSLTQKPF